MVLALHQWALSQPLLTWLTVLVAEYGVFLIPLTLAIAYFWPRTDLPSRREAIVAAGLSFLVALVLVTVVGEAFHRVRPFIAYGLTPLFPHLADSSFPSDHALLAVALAGPLVWRRPRLGVWLLVWGLVVGFARVAAAVHYPSDILGSAAIAVVPTAVGLFLGPILIARIGLLRYLVDDFG